MITAVNRRSSLIQLPAILADLTLALGARGRRASVDGGAADRGRRAGAAIETVPILVAPVSTWLALGSTRR